MSPQALAILCGFWGVCFGVIVSYALLQGRFNKMRAILTARHLAEQFEHLATIEKFRFRSIQVEAELKKILDVIKNAQTKEPGDGTSLTGN